MGFEVSSGPGVFLDVPRDLPIVDSAVVLPRYSKLRIYLALAILLLLTVLLQWLSGAFHTGFTGYPDETSHFVTTAMVREYILQGFPPHPLVFAQNYYRHYPRVGFGHWPPLFYAIASVWTIAAPHSRIWFLLLMAAFTTSTATIFARALSRRYGWVAGASLGAAFVLIPSVQAQTSMIMLDTLLTLTALCAALCFARFLRTENWRDSAAFGLFAACCILTKGNGWALALLPPVAIALTRRWRLCLKASLWVAVLPVAVFCLPWQYFTRSMADQGWVQPAPTIGYTLLSLLRFAENLFRMSPPLFLLALVGLWLVVGRPIFRKRPVDSFHATMASLLLAVWVFHSVVPAGVEDRKLIMGLCGLLAFVPKAIVFLSFRLQSLFPRAGFLKAKLVLTSATLFLLCGFFIPAKDVSAFTQAAKDLLTRPDLAGTCLISSDGDGEGSLISELALLQPRPSRYFLRATKMLTRTDWSGHEEQSLFHSESEIMQALDNIPVDTLILDPAPGRFHFCHQRLLGAMVRHYPDRWRLADSISDSNRPSSPTIMIYRRVGFERDRAIFHPEEMNDTAALSSR